MLLVAFIFMYAGSVNKVNAVEDPIPTITYKATYYPVTESWCCYSGTTGCVPLNCPE